MQMLETHTIGLKEVEYPDPQQEHAAESDCTDDQFIRRN